MKSHAPLLNLLLVPVLTINANHCLADSLNIDSIEDLVAAVDQATIQGSGVIRVEKNAVFELDEPIPEISSNVVIEGNGVTFKAANGYHGGVFKIEEAGSLKLADTYFTGFTRDYADSGWVNYLALVHNLGTVQLSRVTFAFNESPNDIQAAISSVRNQGTALLDNTTFYGNRGWQYAEIVNSGHMTLLNSTIVDNHSLQYFRPIAPSPTKTVIDTTDGITELGNTLLFNEFGNCWLDEDIQLIDLGGNFDSDGSCNLDPSKNTINQEPGIGTFGLHGGLVPTVSLDSNSRAIDTGLNSNCSAMDARFANRPVQGLLGNALNCDTGAFEYGGGFGNSKLAANGMNGLWYNAEQDGHYVHVMRVSPYRVYINWTTFDHESNHLWIYAVIETTGSTSFSGTAYINNGGKLETSEELVGAEASVWGLIEISFDSCTSGIFKYQANDADIGEGEFLMDRLAFYEGGGCSDN